MKKKRYIKHIVNWPSDRQNQIYNPRYISVNTAIVSLKISDATNSSNNHKADLDVKIDKTHVVCSQASAQQCINTHRFDRSIRIWGDPNLRRDWHTNGKVEDKKRLIQILIIGMHQIAGFQV